MGKVKYDACLDIIEAVLKELPKAVDESLDESSDVLKLIGSEEMKATFIAGFKQGSDSMIDAVTRVVSKLRDN